MPTDPSSLETHYTAIRTRIGLALKSRYELATALPQQMLALLLQLGERENTTESPMVPSPARRHRQSQADGREMEEE